MDDLKQCVAKLQKLNKLLEGNSLRRVTERVAQRAKPIATAVVQPNTLSHWGRGKRRGGYRVQAKYNMKSDSQAELVPTIPPLAALLEKGSGSTWSAPKRRGSPRRKRGSIATYHRAPVPPRGAWSKTYPPVERATPKFVDDEVVRILREVF